MNIFPFGILKMRRCALSRDIAISRRSESLIISFLFLLTLENNHQFFYNSLHFINPQQHYQSHSLLQHIFFGSPRLADFEVIIPIKIFLNTHLSEKILQKAHIMNKLY